MNIEVIQNNEYIRTKNGHIGKVINNQYYMLLYIETDTGLYLRENIVKHSKNIIDLIEVGDYVNGSEVTNYYYVGEQKVLVINNKKITYEENENFISNSAIESVVTKEQYKSVEYVF